MVSGSAALPVPLRHEWERISGGQILLERYGMSELGMVLSHGLANEDRVEGTVGLPLPGVNVRLAINDDKTGDEKDVTENMNVSGEIQVKGPNVFKEYWNKPEATAKEFTASGWFKTGDTALRIPPHGFYRILGRTSVDIIKSGGYKISALEIERELLGHPQISDAAVCGVEDAEWGQRVGAVVVIKKAEDEKALDLESLREWMKPRLAAYKIPTLLRVMDEMPRNAMGKVNKKQLVSVFSDNYN
ncbi:uncharacterized protein VTP21DRAFT_8017 [Calcarisporiella thermophila]|uniref:uncharacterized protein n=1 Tax=Calcarisporiella thermophila TaxID=911321 RepID=UPI0037429E8B